VKKLAVLKREGKKDIRPVRVEVFQREKDLVVACVFSRTEEITKNDKFLQVRGADRAVLPDTGVQIGRLPESIER
jgi:hypothetical protein